MLPFLDYKGEYMVCSAAHFFFLKMTNLLKK